VSGDRYLVVLHYSGLYSKYFTSGPHTPILVRPLSLVSRKVYALSYLRHLLEHVVYLKRVFVFRRASEDIR
jgi:hypothetical protein